MPIQTLPATSPLESILAAFTGDGAVIVSDVLSDTAADTVCSGLAPFIDSTPPGRDDFTGTATKRTGALVARVPAVRDIVLDRIALPAARAFLAPYTERIVLHLTQSIQIGPGQGNQPLHRDRLAWGTHIPQSIEPQFNTMWALTDFTQENGATRVVPGSHTWDWERRAETADFTQAVMRRGSVLFYSGSVLHSGGENRTKAPRLGLNITYCLGWLRQEENQYLSCPPDIARDLEPELQELLGYTQGNYALGYYSDPTAPHEKADLLPPEMALGRMPRDEARFSISEATEEGASAAFVEELTRQNA